ncbi:MAG: Clp protease N-terminal domain-containing protein [Gaiellaceae bacterium]
MLQEGMLDEASRLRDRCADAERELDLARVDYHDAIRRLHAAGGSMREIAERLGLSHQRVHQIVDDAGASSARKHAERLLGEVKNRALRWPFERFTRRAREVVVLAEREARRLGHDHVGTEHILLGLLSLDEEPAGRALAELGVRRDAVRREVVRAMGQGQAGNARHLPFTPRTKQALEGALREARALGHQYIGTEHVLLGLVREEDGVAARVLAELEAPADEVRSAVAAILRA